MQICEVEINSCQIVSDGSLEGKMICKYDDNGNPIEELYYNPEGILIEKTISKYDGKGNLIEDKCLQIEGDLEIFCSGGIYEYEYEYY